MKHFILYLTLLLGTSAMAQDDSTEEIDAPSAEEYVEEGEFSEQTPEDEYEEEGSSIDHNLVKPEETHALKNFQDEKLYHEGFDESKWRDVVGENDFRQDAPDPPNIRMPGMSWAGDLLKAVGYGVIIAIVLLLLYFVFKNIKLNKKVKQAGVTPFASHDDEDIREMDIPSMLQKALAEKNFKLAVRLYFLLLLRNLHDAGHIKWEKDKTNRDYLTELFSKENLYDDVRKLTLHYEEVWYGDHHFPEASLLSLISRFKSLQDKINPIKSL